MIPPSVISVTLGWTADVLPEAVSEKMQAMKETNGLGIRRRS
jgi:hypothetical protein